jgi:exodeoxyribonuclease VII large subunit
VNLRQILQTAKNELSHSGLQLSQIASSLFKQQRAYLESRLELLSALSPSAVLARGYAIVRTEGGVVRTGTRLAPNAIVDVELVDSEFTATVNTITQKAGHGKRR